MADKLAKLRQQYPWLEPWMMVAAVIAAVLFLYSAWLGLRYLDATSQVDSLRPQSDNLRTGVILLGESRETQDSSKTEQEQRLEVLQALFDHPQTDVLMTTASEIARENNVAVERIGVGKLAPEEIEDEAVYQLLPMDLALKGKESDIYRFLARLNQTIPVASVADIRLGNLGIPGLIPVAQVSLVFYLFPEPYTEEE